MKLKKPAVAVLSLFFMSAVAPAADEPVAKDAPAADKPADKKANPNEKRELLSDHQTVAKLTRVQFRKCMGRTSLCPDQCGHSGNFVVFEIVAYLKYEKPGKYGDPKQTTYLLQIDDNHQNLKVSKELAETAKGLKSGDFVLLDWRHEYVTRKEGGGSSSFPERPIAKLEKITPEEADKLVGKAVK